LLEILLALVVLSIMGVMVFGGFRNIVEATTHGEEAMESLHHGEIIMEQLVSSLRSAAFYENNPRRYGLLHEDGSGSPPDDVVSWVSSTMAFIPPRYPTQQGLHRIYLSMEEEDGQKGLAVSAYPHLLDPEDPDVEEVKPWIVSTRVKGLDIRFYDDAKEDWVDEWERERQLPQSVEVVLWMEPLVKGGKPRKLIRRVDIPVGRYSRATRRGQRPPQVGTGNPGANPNDRAVIVTPPPGGEGRGQP